MRTPAPWQRSAAGVAAVIDSSWVAGVCWWCCCCCCCRAQFFACIVRYGQAEEPHVEHGCVVVFVSCGCVARLASAAAVAGGAHAVLFVVSFPQQFQPPTREFADVLVRARFEHDCCLVATAAACFFTSRRCRCNGTGWPGSHLRYPRRQKDSHHIHCTNVPGSMEMSTIFTRSRCGAASCVIGTVVLNRARRTYNNVVATQRPLQSFVSFFVPVSGTGTGRCPLNFLFHMSVLLFFLCLVPDHIATDYVAHFQNKKTVWTKPADLTRRMYRNPTHLRKSSTSSLEEEVVASSFYHSPLATRASIPRHITRHSAPRETAQHCCRMIIQYIELKNKFLGYNLTNRQ